jgi:hypothetical protein
MSPSRSISPHAQPTVRALTLVENVESGNAVGELSSASFGDVDVLFEIGG